MAGETDEAAVAAERIEAALERIARLAPQPHQLEAGQPVPAEFAERLDRLIGRLRTALEAKS